MPSFPPSSPVATTDTPVHSDLVAVIADLVTLHADLTSAITELGQKIEPADLAALAKDATFTARLPAALDADGGVKSHVQNFPATQPVSATALPLPAGAAADASLVDLLSRVGPTASDTLLSLLRQVVTNTATEAAKVTHLDLTADTLNLSTDNVEGLLTTLNALVASETTLAALRTANHTDLVALATALATLNAKDFATQAGSAAILAKLSADPATQTTLAAFQAASHTDLLALLASIGATGDASSSSTVIGLLKWLKAGPLLVGARSVVRTAFTYTGGLLTGYTEDGVVWTIARNADGTIASVTHA